MPQIIFLPNEEICPDGAVIDAEPGQTVCDAALANDIEIEHACEKSCACTTCHVIVREGFDSLNESSEDEDDLLDKAWGLDLVFGLVLGVALQGLVFGIEYGMGWVTIRGTAQAASGSSFG